MAAAEYEPEADVLSDGVACSWISCEVDTFHALATAVLEDQLSYEAKQEALEEADSALYSEQPPRRYAYVAPSDRPPEEDFDLLFDAYRDIVKEDRQDILENSFHAIKGIAASVVSAIAGGKLLLDGHFEAGSLLFLGGAGYGYLIAQEIPDGYSVPTLWEGLKYYKENETLPPTDKQYNRWGDIEEKLSLNTDGIMKIDLGGLPEMKDHDIVYDDEIQNIDLEAAGLIDNEELPDGCEIREFVFDTEIPVSTGAAAPV